MISNYAFNQTRTYNREVSQKPFRQIMAYHCIFWHIQTFQVCSGIIQTYSGIFRTLSNIYKLAFCKNYYSYSCFHKLKLFSHYIVVNFVKLESGRLFHEATPWLPQKEKSLNFRVSRLLENDISEKCIIEFKNSFHSKTQRYTQIRLCKVISWVIF